MRTVAATSTQIPLVNTRPGSAVHDLLASLRGEENDEISRAMWAEFRAELLPKLESLRDCPDSATLKNQLHSLRGENSQFGLSLLEIFLFAWEKKETDSLAALPEFLPGALAIARLSLDAVEDDLPHLKARLPGRG